MSLGNARLTSIKIGARINIKNLPKHSLNMDIQSCNVFMKIRAYALMVFVICQQPHFVMRFASWQGLAFLLVRKEPIIMPPQRLTCQQLSSGEIGRRQKSWATKDRFILPAANRKLAATSILVRIVAKF